MHESTGESLLSALAGDFPLARIFPARSKGEKKAPSGARERVTEIVCVSLDLYHGVISPPTLPPRTHALFFLRSLSLPTYLSLSGLSLPCG